MAAAGAQSARVFDEWASTNKAFFTNGTRSYVIHHFTPNMTVTTKGPVQPNMILKCDDSVVVDNLRDTMETWSITKNDREVRRSHRRRDAS